MAIALTYFANRLSDDELVMLLRQRENFYIETISAMDMLTRRMQALLATDGLHSVVQIAPQNTAPLSFIPNPITDTVFILSGLWALLRRIAQRFTRPRCDVLLRVTSETAMRVVFRPSARPSAARPTP